MGELELLAKHTIRTNIEPFFLVTLRQISGGNNLTTPDPFIDSDPQNTQNLFIAVYNF
jgi:hypothetical protein